MYTVAEIAADRESVKLHTDSSGLVWYLRGDSPPLGSGMLVDDFLRSNLSKYMENVRLVGSAENADLIHKLYAWKKNSNKLLKSVKLRAPRIGRAVSNNQHPDAILFELRRLMSDLPGSLGGWHEATNADFVAYALKK